MRRIMLCSALPQVVGLLMIASPLAAQRALTGGVISSGPQGYWIDLDNDDRQPKLIIDPAQTRITIEGEVDRNFLKRGIYVKLDVELDDKGKGIGEVGALEVVTPSATMMEGLTERTESGKSISTVIGKITRARRDSFTVALPRKSSKWRSVQFTLAKNAKLKLNGFTDHTVAQTGDTVEFTGQIYRSRELLRGVLIETLDHDKFVATSLTLKLRAPLGKKR